jgi:antirestriction protein
MTTQIIEQKELRVYVGTFGKYNRGSLAGKWLNIKDYKNVDDFHKACEQLHSNEYDPEFMFQDWDYIPNSFINDGWINPKLFELIHHPNMEHIDINTLFDFLDDVDFTNLETYEIIEKFDECYRGYWDSFREFAYEEFGKCPHGCRCENYIDWDKYERDLQQDYTYTDKRNVFSKNY